MALHILRSVSQDIAECPCYSVMADECTDCSNKEQFTVCIRWVDKELKEQEDFIGIYQVDTIDADCLLSAIRDVLLRMNVKLVQCHDQCYDSASNMSDACGGMAKKIIDKESRALYSHCYGHALNLAVSDTMKKSLLCKDALDTAFEVKHLIKFSRKSNVAFEKFRSSQQDTSSPGDIRTFCKTCWIVRGDALENILLNYGALNELWDECLVSPILLDSDVKARIIGVKAMICEFKFLFSLKLSKTILNVTHNLSKALQTSSLSAAKA